jgi:predicted secreted protein
MGKADGQLGFSGYFEGPFVLGNIQIGGNDDGYASIDITLTSDGEVELVKDA